MVPNGLLCKNTFFDIPEDTDVPEGPATCPPASDGWWPSSSSDTQLSWPTSPSFFDLPLNVELPAIPSTPDQWVDSVSPSAWPRRTCDLQTPEWFERPIRRGGEHGFGSQQVLKDFDPCVQGKVQSPSRSTPSLPRRTPDPFEDTPSPMEQGYGRSPSRFDQLLTAEVSHLDASERTPTIAGWEPLLLATAPQFGLEPPIWPEPAEFWPFHLHQAAAPWLDRRRPREAQKAPLPAGLLLPGQLGRHEESPKARRKRGSREAEPEPSAQSPLPSGAFIDLGLLERK